MQPPVSGTEPVEQGLNIVWETAATPLTVKQMWRASQIHSNAPLTLDGREIKWVYCVGHIIDIDDRGRFYSLKIEDGSAGELTVFLWKKDEHHYWRVFADLLEKGMIAQNMYARVSGELKGSKGYKNSITARSVVRIKDSHEIFFHLFECVVAAQNCEKLLKEQEKEGEQRSSSDAPGTSSAHVDGEAGSKEDKDKDEEKPPLEIDSSDDELENVTNPGHPDDSSDDEGGGEKGLEVEESTDSDSEESKPAHEGTETVVNGATAKTQESGTEANGSAQEMRQVQESLQALSLTSADRNRDESSIKPDSQDVHDEPTPESDAPHDPLSKLTNAQRALISHMTQRREEVWEAGEEEWIGLHISEMARVLKRQKNMSVAKIGEAVDDLIEAGYIFSTVDEFHFDVKDL